MTLALHRAIHAGLIASCTVLAGCTLDFGRYRFDAGLDTVDAAVRGSRERAATAGDAGGDASRGAVDAGDAAAPPP